MPFLQIHGLRGVIPTVEWILNAKMAARARIPLSCARNRRFYGTHLVAATHEGPTAAQRQTNAALVNYQRSPIEIPGMETHSLTKAMMQSSKAGFTKRVSAADMAQSVWDKYVARAIELRDKFSAKNLAIVMISAAKSNVTKREFYDAMAERLVTKCQNYISTYKIDPRTFFAGDFRTEFTGFNIYTIASACTAAGYKNEKLLKLLFKVSEIKLLYYERYLDHAMRGESPQGAAAPLGTQKEDRFTFEDVAGILHAYAWADVAIPEMVTKYGTILRKMHQTAREGGPEGTLHTGEVTPKEIAIAVNALVKLGDRSRKTYELALEYLENELESLSVRDATMIFCAIVKMGLGQDLDELTENVIRRLEGLRFDAESLISLSTAIVTVLNRELREKRDELRTAFTKLFEREAYLVLTNTELNNAALVQLLYNSAVLGSTGVAMTLLSHEGLKGVGLTGSRLDVTQLLTSLNLIHSSGSEPVREAVHNLAVLAVKQYGNRLKYVLHPHELGLAKTRARPPDLYNILRLEAKGLLDAEASDINRDWEELTEEMREIGPENVNVLASMLSCVGKLRPSKEFAKFAKLCGDFCARFFRHIDDERGCKALQLDTVAALVHALSRFRMKPHELLKKFSVVVKAHVDDKINNGDLDNVNYMAVFNVVSSYAKLGIPENKLFEPKSRHSLSKGTGEDIHNAAFKSISRFLGTCHVENINTQMAANGLHSLALVGFDKFSRVTLARLIERYVNEAAKSRTELAKHGETSGEPKELHSQLDITLMMLHILVKQGFFRTRAFDWYLKRMRKAFLNVGGRSQTKGRERTGSGELAVRQAEAGDKMSGLHRSVMSVLKTGNRELRAEVPWKRGTYHIDVVVEAGRRKVFVEIDGPYHYYAQTVDRVSSSRAKHYILTNSGHRLVHIPYFEWAKHANREDKTKYLSQKLSGLVSF